MKKVVTLLGCATIVASSSALASDPSLEEVVVYGELSRFSALKSDTPVMEVSRSISIISEQEMLDRGALSLGDTFTYSAGVSGQPFGYATRSDWIKVRGLQVPQYQDSLQSLFGDYNNTRPHVYTLEQVEILKGPASVLYGQGSPGGLVNIVSKRPRDQSSHQIVAEYGNFDHMQLAIDSTGKVPTSENWLYRFIGVYQDSGSQVDQIDQKVTVLAPSVIWQLGEKTEINLLLNYTDTQGDAAAQFLPIAGTLEPAANGKHIGNSTYLGEPGFNKFDATSYSVTLLATHRFNDIWTMEFTSRYTDATADYQQAWPAFIGGDRYVYNSDGSLYKDGTVPRTFYRSDATSEQKAVDIRFRANFDTGSISHDVLMGGQYQDITTGNAGYYAYALGYAFGLGEPNTALGDTYWINVFDPVYGNVPPDALFDTLYKKDLDNTVEDAGLYISDHMSFGNWHLTVGGRWDKTENKTGDLTQDDDETSVSAGLLYQFDSGLAPYVNYAESFEPVIGDNGQGEPLKPQRGEQVEVGLKYQPASFPAMVTLAWFDLEQSNLPDPLSTPGDYKQQLGITTIDGLELESVAQLGDFRVELNLSKLNTETPDGWRLAGIAQDQASSWVGWRPQSYWQGFKAGVGVRYVGESWGGFDRIKTPSYTLGDAMLGWEMEHWDLALNVHNIADKDFYATCPARGGCFPGNQRTVVGRVSYQF